MDMEIIFSKEKGEGKGEGEDDLNKFQTICALNSCEQTLLMFDQPNIRWKT